MYTRQSNHLLTQLEIITPTLEDQTSTKYVIRIVPINHVKDFTKEYEKIYDNPPSHFKPILYYNCAHHYERLINDMKYKNFKTIKITPHKENTWIVTQVSPLILPTIVRTTAQQTQIDQPVNIQNWYDNIFQPFIKFKLFSYFEDDDVQPLVQQILEVKNINISDTLKFQDNYLKNTKDPIFHHFILTNPEETVDNEYVLTSKDIINIIIHCIRYYVLSDKKVNKDQVPKIKLRTCELTNTTYINNKEIYLCDIPVILEHFNITEENIFEIKQNIAIKVFEDEDNVTPYEPRNQSSFKPISNVQRKIPQEELDEFFETLSYIKKPSLPHISSTPTHPEKPLTAKHVYLNSLTNKLHHLDTPILLLKELELITEFTPKTQLGNILFEELPNVQSISDIKYDIDHFLKILEKLPSSKKPIVAKSSTTLLPELSEQTKHTKSYVEKFKDDTAETIAHQVIEKVFDYISNFIEPKNINMNKIGKDLVDLGVSKTRKTRGYYYNIRNPTHKEITNLFTANKTT